MSGSGRSQKKHQKEVKRKKLQKQKALQAAQTHRVPPREIRNALLEAHELMDDGYFDEAEEILTTEQRRHRNSPELLESLADLYQRTKDHRSLENVAVQLVRVQPHDPEAQLLKAQSSMYCGRVAAALVGYRRFLDKWPQHKYASKARSAIEILEPEVAKRLPTFDLAESELEFLVMHDQMLQKLMASDFDGAILSAKELLAAKPHMVSARNNLVVALFQVGRMQEAISVVRETLEIYPDNRFAEATLGRVLFLTGQFEEAHSVARHISDSPSDQQDAAAMQAELLGLMGYDDELLQLVEHAERIPDKAPQCRGVLNHYKAFALKRLGRDKEAVKCWEQSLKDYPHLTPASQNLSELKSGIDGHAPWPDAFGKWLPRRALDEFFDFLQADKSPQKARMTEALDRWPHIRTLIPALLDRGDRSGREFAVIIAKGDGSEEMLDALETFATSNRGPDEMRTSVIAYLRDHGRLSEGSVPFWSRGAWTEVMVNSTEIHSDTKIHKNLRVVELTNRGLLAMRREDGDAAEKIFRECIELDPNFPTAIHNLVGALLMKPGKECETEAKQILQNLFERFPDYFFARTTLAQLAILDGRIEEAQELIMPLMSLTRQHVSEAMALADVNAAIAIARDQLQSARVSLGLMKQLDDDDPRVKQLEGRLAAIENISDVFGQNRWPRLG